MKQDNQETRTILLVDDEAGIRNVLSITLTHTGYTVVTAPDGETAMHLYKKHTPDIVVTDIKMPGIDGIELLKLIKEENPETEVIMITGHGDMGLAVQSLKYEAADFITKPIDTDTLELALEKACDRISINQKIKHYMEDLENLVDAKNKEINESEKLVTIGQTIAGMTHAIKNIAGGLKGSSFVLEQGIEQENREYMKKGWDMMKGNIDKITNLSLDLLNYAKTTSLDYRQILPSVPAREVYDLMKLRAEKLGIELRIHVEELESPVYMDPASVHTCLLNLVSNACDSFSDETCDDRNKQVSLFVKQTGNRSANYQVADNGSGIKRKIKERLFKHFITTKGTRGTGFGLMTTKKIVEEHSSGLKLKESSQQIPSINSNSE